MAGYDVNGAPLNGSSETVTIPREEWEEMKSQVNEIHAFIKGVGEALNNPMLKSMLPPNMRGLV